MKVKATELMIDDWVYVSKNFTQKYHKIRALSNDEDDVLRGIYINGYGVENRSVFSPNDIEPIPLTPEILEKNGWETENFGRRQEWWLDKTKFPIVRYSANDALQHNGIVLKYVHQLQHALKLFGIDKEITL